MRGFTDEFHAASGAAEGFKTTLYILHTDTGSAASGGSGNSIASVVQSALGKPYGCSKGSAFIKQKLSGARESVILSA